jgi:hypothetical protein
LHSYCADFGFQAHDAGEDARAMFALMEFMVKFFLDNIKCAASGPKRPAAGSMLAYFQKKPCNGGKALD